MTVETLKDSARLSEIYNLRVEAYSNSSYSKFINFEKHPNGRSDHLEEQSIHFVIHKSNKIIASARLTEMQSIEELPYHRIFSQIELPSVKPFWFFSKLVVSPSYKGQMLRKQLDDARFGYLNSLKQKTFALMTAKEWRAKELISNDWTSFGKVDFSLDNTYPYATNEDTFVLIYNTEI